MVDANQGYDLMTCLEMAPFLKDCKVKWLEEPLPWHSFAGYKELRAKTDIPIAAGESETTMQGYTEAITNGVVDVIEPDLPACGGITTAKRIANLAFALQVEFQPHIFGRFSGFLPLCICLRPCQIIRAGVSFPVRFSWSGTLIQTLWLSAY